MNSRYTTEMNMMYVQRSRKRGAKMSVGVASVVLHLTDNTQRVRLIKQTTVVRTHDGKLRRETTAVHIHSTVR